MTLYGGRGVRTLESEALPLSPNNGYIHVYNPGAGADNPMMSKFSYKNKPSISSFICCKCFPFDDF